MYIAHLCIAAPYVTEAVAQRLQELHHTVVVALVILHQSLTHGQPHALSQLVLVVLFWLSGDTDGHDRNMTAAKI